MPAPNRRINKIYGPGYARSLIERFPGLHFDLAVPPPNSIYTPSGARHSTLYTSDNLRDDRKSVLEAHPDRVLGERSRHLIAYQNAWRLMTGENWAA